MIALTQDGEHKNITASGTATRLFQNLGASIRFMGFYDVKNARLLERLDSGTLRREPCLDEGKFNKFMDFLGGHREAT